MHTLFAPDLGILCRMRPLTHRPPQKNFTRPPFDLLKACQEILRIPSPSSMNPKDHRGNMKVVEYLVSLSRGVLNARILRSPLSPRDAILILWPKAEAFPARGGLALHTHLDTVQAGSLDEWTLAGPYSGALRGSYLVGLGSSDVKCDALCKIWALMHLQAHSLLRMPVYFVGSFSEEIGMLGMKWLASKKIIRPQWALIGEPSEGHLSYANKGFAVLRLEIPIRWENSRHPAQTFQFKGKGGHSSAPQKAKNAILLFLDRLQKNPRLPISEFRGSVGPNTIPGFFEVSSGNRILSLQTVKKLVTVYSEYKDFSKRIEKQKKMNLLTPSTATSSWTELRIEKDKIFITLDLRLLPGQEARQLSKLWKSSNRLRVVRESLSFYEKPHSEFGKFLNPFLGRGKKFITKSGANEAPYYSRLGAQAFVHAPGRSYGNIHSPNEKVSIKSLHEAAMFYRRVIEGLCL